jgi:hypothetical protein
MAMEARDPEQTAMIEIATKARRVGSVLILKSNFIDELDWPAIREDDLRAKELGGSIADGRECRNNRS